MKKPIASFLLLCLLAALLSGCRDGPGPAGTTEAPDGSSAAPTSAPTAAPTEEATGPVLEDPYPAEAYQYRPGSPVDYDGDRDLWNFSADGGRVRQTVYRYDPEAAEPFTPLRVLEYEDFPGYAADEESGEPPRFRGRYSLGIDAFDPLSAGPWNVAPVRDPAVFGAFESLVLSLDYSAPVQGAEFYSFGFHLTDADGKEDIYTVSRGGQVILNGEAGSTVPLSEEALDYFFAVHLSSKLYAAETVYWYTGSFDDTVYALRLQSGGKTVYLTREKRDSFAACFSDPSDWEPIPSSFACVPRWNRGPGEHGETLAKVSYGAYDEQTGEFTESRSFEICEDGQVLVPRGGVIGPEYGYGFGEMICDKLTGDGWLVSVRRFDVSVLENYLP